MTATVAVVGVCHARTPAALRERLHLAPERAEALARLLADDSHEAVVLATCNRTELYLTGADLADAERRAALALADLGEGSSLPATAYVQADELAARQLFRVAAGLDSIVVGDTHVAAQVRQAHRAARAAGTTGPLLDRLFEAAAVASKRVRSETSVASGPKSIPAAAVAAAAQIAGPLSQRRLLVIGAGAMAKLAALNAASRGCAGIVVTNRDVARAQELANQIGGRAASLDTLSAELAAADVVFSATAASGFVLSAELASAASSRPRQRPLAVFDLALPRDVDPAFRDEPHVRLLDLDDLGLVVTASGRVRRAELGRAEAIASEEAKRYETWRRSRAAVPAIHALHSNAEHTRRSVLSRHVAAIARLAPEERKLVETITSELVAKLLHEPTVELRQRALERSA